MPISPTIIAFSTHNFCSYFVDGPFWIFYPLDLDQETTGRSVSRVRLSFCILRVGIRRRQTFLPLSPADYSPRDTVNPKRLFLPPASLRFTCPEGNDCVTMALGIWQSQAIHVLALFRSSFNSWRYRNQGQASVEIKYLLGLATDATKVISYVPSRTERRGLH